MVVGGLACVLVLFISSAFVGFVVSVVSPVAVLVGVSSVSSVGVVFFFFTMSYVNEEVFVVVALLPADCSV